MRNLRNELKQGGHLIGTWLNSGSPVVAELLAGCGFDFVCVDAEHSPVDLTQAHTIFQAVTSGNTDCLAGVRLHGVDYALTKRYLDSGARLVIGPLVNTAEQARQLVEAVKYPPLGKRGVGFCRANQYGHRLKDEFDTANDHILTVVQIEDIEAVNNIEDIVAVPGIDAVFIGPYDLSASMGITAQFDRPEFIEARDRILNACKAKGIFPGIHVVQPDPEELLQRIKEGYQLTAFSLDITMLQFIARGAFTKFKAAGVRK